jgi:hypothetical protein
MLLSIVENTLKQFNNDLELILKDKYEDILIYGSISINEFSPHQEDIDFIVTLNDNLSDIEINQIFKLHDKYRTKALENLEYQLEGVYYPNYILNQMQEEFTGCYIGTERKGWKKINSFVHNCFDLMQLKNNGISYKNKYINIYGPTFNEIKCFIQNEIINFKELLENNTIPSYVVIEFSARTIFYLNHHKIGSKNKSYKEYFEKYMKKDYSNIISVQNNYKNIDKELPEHKELAMQSLNHLNNLIDGNGPNVI